MQSRAANTVLSIFLVLDSARSRLAHFLAAFAPIEEKLAPATVATDIYFAASTEISLLAWHLERSKLAPVDLRWALQQAQAAGAPVLDPSRLDEGDRQAFYGSYLDGYDFRAENLCGPRAALLELGRQLGSGRESADSSDELQAITTVKEPCPPELDEEPAPITALSPNTAPRRAPPPLPDSLKGRRLGSSPPPPRAAVPHERQPRGKRAPAHRTPKQREEFALVEQAAMARAEALRRAPTVEYPLDSDTPITARFAGGDRPRGKGRHRERKPTVPATPVAKKSRTSPAGTSRENTQQGRPIPPPPTTPRPRRVANGSGSNPIIDERDAVTPAIRVRYQRGGEWVTTRLRSLSLKGCYLVAGALPHKGDNVRVEISFAGVGAAIQGVVYHVTTVEDAAQTGSAGFALRFPPDDTPMRRELAELLKQAKAEGITIKPPPTRAFVRFPVSWPIRMGTKRRGFRAEALDVSYGGLFIVTGQNLEGEELAFRLPLDTGGMPICGRARVARKVTEEVALQRGIRAGYGLEIVGLSDADIPRYGSFLRRVRQRVERRVLVAAAPGRMKQLMAAFTAIGYTVTGGSDPDAVMYLATREKRLPDAAVIDASLAAQGVDKNKLARSFADRGVACVTADNEPPTLTRAVVDRLLGVNA